MKPKVLEAYLKHDCDCECLSGNPCNCGLHEAIKSVQKKTSAKSVAMARLLKQIENVLKTLTE